MSDHSRGGNDTFQGSRQADNTFFGDAGGNMSGLAQGGDDFFTAKSGSRNTFYGDAAGGFLRWNALDNSTQRSLIQVSTDRSCAGESWAWPSVSSFPPATMSQVGL